MATICPYYFLGGGSTSCGDNTRNASQLKDIHLNEDGEVTGFTESCLRRPNAPVPAERSLLLRLKAFLRRSYNGVPYPEDLRRDQSVSKATQGRGDESKSSKKTSGVRGGLENLSASVPKSESVHTEIDSPKLVTISSNDEDTPPPMPADPPPYYFDETKQTFIVAPLKTSLMIDREHPERMRGMLRERYVKRVAAYQIIHDQNMARKVSPFQSSKLENAEPVAV